MNYFTDLSIKYANQRSYLDDLFHVYPTIREGTREVDNIRWRPKGRHWRSEVSALEQLDKDGLIEWSSNGNPRKKIYLEEQGGKRVQDIWEYKDPQYPVYPTEKNDELLDLIVKTSTDKNSIVLDCFCGSGTTLQAAQLNSRNWIGIDQSNEAVKATVKKLQQLNGDLFSGGSDYKFYSADQNKIKYAEI